LRWRERQYNGARHKPDAIDVLRDVLHVFHNESFCLYLSLLRNGSVAAGVCSHSLTSNVAAALWVIMFHHPVLIIIITLC
jgi:hypothetical protein